MLKAATEALKATREMADMLKAATEALKATSDVMAVVLRH